MPRQGYSVHVNDGEKITDKITVYPSGFYTREIEGSGWRVVLFAHDLDTLKFPLNAEIEYAEPIKNDSNEDD